MIWQIVLLVSSQQLFYTVASGSYPYEHETKHGVTVDTKYPGTACERMVNVVDKIKALKSDDLNGQQWTKVRSKLLAAGGLKEDSSTGHSFNDWNHCDLTTMGGTVQKNSNADGKVSGISTKNDLSAHIKAASLPSLGEGGSWSTCILGCNKTPPQDVAHLQFKSRIAFKLVWCHPDYKKFVLVDDEGKLLNQGSILEGDSTVPPLYQRRKNYETVKGGIYEAAAIAVGK